MTTVETTLGPLRGVEDHGVNRFRGIRYAEPPVGDRRFAPPVPSGPWDGTYDATRFGNRAVQPPMAAVFGGPGPGEVDEDCLFLNVFTPATDDRRRPVLCWIHGGAYTTGSGNDYDASMLAAQGDVVVVTVNYRLGVFGFLDLSAHDPALAGSASNGFRDQICALEWVRDHIAAFGGDPGDVTIFGESAGGGSVLALLAAPAAEGLFHKAMAHSPGGVNTPPVQWSEPVAAQLDGDGPVLERLRAAPASQLLKAQTSSGFNGGDIDGTVVTRHPVDAIAERGPSGVPLLIGSNHDEGTLFSSIMSTVPGMFEAVTAHIAGQVMRGTDPGAYLDGLRSTRPDDDEIGIGEQVWLDLFRRPAVEAAAAATAAGPGGWLYRFDLPTTEFGGKLGATHASEIAFTFNWFASEEPAGFVLHDRSDPEVRDLAQRWSDTVLAFARTGDPNGAGLPEWPRYDADQRPCLILDTSCRVELDPDADRRRHWVGAETTPLLA